MTVGFHPLAAQELTEAALFYEGRATGLGAEFLDQVESLIALLKVYPALGRPAPQNLRTIPTRRFPYTLVYQDLPEWLYILAVAHQRRRPQYWAGRARAP